MIKNAQSVPRIKNSGAISCLLSSWRVYVSDIIWKLKSKELSFCHKLWFY